MPRRRPVRRMTPTPTEPVGGSEIRSDPSEGERHDPGNDDGRERRPIPGGVRHEGRREARPPRLEGLDGVPRPDRGEPRLGAVRLGRGRAGRASCPTPRSRRSSRRPATSASPRPRCCSAPTTREEADDDQRHQPTGPGRSHHRPDRRPLLHGHRQRQRRQDGDRRHQRARRPPRSPGRVVRRGQRDRRRAWPRPWRRSSSSGSASTSSSAASTARRARPSRDRSSTRPETLYIYPEQYEGQECHPLIFCTGPVPAQQVEPFFPWLMRADRGEDVLHAVGRLHLAAHDEQEGA